MQVVFKDFQWEGKTDNATEKKEREKIKMTRERGSHKKPSKYRRVSFPLNLQVRTQSLCVISAKAIETMHAGMR